jgi:hypothetical protein
MACAMSRGLSEIAAITEELVCCCAGFGCAGTAGFAGGIAGAGGVAAGSAGELFAGGSPKTFELDADVSSVADSALR